MNFLVATPQVQWERIGREALSIFIDNLNSEIATLESDYAQEDKEFSIKRESFHNQIRIERIDIKNFHLGHKPSLINAPIEYYPNICVNVDLAVPLPNSGEDHFDTYNLRLWVEIMCKATHQDGLDPEE